MRSSTWVWLLLEAVFVRAMIDVVYGNSEVDALYALRDSLVDPNDVLQSWDPVTINPCTWFHVTCDRHNLVTRLDLGGANLSGNLVPDLGKLKHLQYLELFNNNLQGAIPAELGNLKRLVSLDLYDNRLSGMIPSKLGKLKSLVFLRLNNNHLSGRIPPSLTRIRSLKVVDLSNNSFCGTIPRSGAFKHIPLTNFKDNPHLKGPELFGLTSHDTSCP